MSWLARCGRNDRTVAEVGVHVLAALWHHVRLRDATLVQMLPGRPRR